MSVEEKLIMVDERIVHMGKNSLSNETPRSTFECMDCGHRLEADHHPMECPDCEGEMLNISNPRE